jgi:AcrR family transcriptional regulator
LEAATRVLATEGLSATTASIAREAGVANGSLFMYFETKTELFNQLYVRLKSERAAAGLKGFAPEGESRKQCFLVWTNWMEWAVVHPEKRRALALLEAWDEMTPASRAAGEKAMAGMRALVKRIHARGAMSAAPMGLLVALMHSAAEATMDAVVGVEDEAGRETVCRTGFDAVWRMIG